MATRKTQRECRSFRATDGAASSSTLSPSTHGIPSRASPSTARSLVGDGEASVFVNAQIDWKETPEAHVFKVDLPGLRKEEVKVEIEEGRVLQISGERSKEVEEGNDRWHRVERSRGKFLRRFRLPENARVDQVRAAMEHGVLTVTMPKEELKSIEISG
ncbi:heat shock protein [Nymphaea thermarum]|nr:heat shock protein [Nymphaea thermarum]